VGAEVASTRLPKEILREIDREAARRGISRSVYLADVIERGALREPSADAAGAAGALRVALTSELREIREGQRSLSHTLRDIQAALKTDTFASSAGGSCVAGAVPAGRAVLDRLMFSTFFSEALIKRVSALLYRNPGELSQVVREAREQAEQKRSSGASGSREQIPPRGHRESSVGGRPNGAHLRRQRGGVLCRLQRPLTTRSCPRRVLRRVAPDGPLARAGWKRS